MEDEGVSKDKFSISRPLKKKPKIIKFHSTFNYLSIAISLYSLATNKVLQALTPLYLSSYYLYSLGGSLSIKKRSTEVYLYITYEIEIKLQKAVE